MNPDNTSFRLVRFKRQPWHQTLEKMAAPGGVDTEDDTRDGIETGITDQIESLILILRSIPTTIDDYETIAGAINAQIQFLNRMLRIIPGGVDGAIDDRDGIDPPATY